MKPRGGTRKQRTQNRWRPGRVRNMVINPIYKGEYHYGRRSRKERAVIVAQIEPLVSSELWGRGQQALAEHRIMAKKTRQVHVLRSLIRCNICGSNYSWTLGRGVMWYRCNKQISYTLRGEPRCPGISVRGDYLEPLIWADVERWLRQPGPLLDELATARNNTSASASPTGASAPPPAMTASRRNGRMPSGKTAMRGARTQAR